MQSIRAFGQVLLHPRARSTSLDVDVFSIFTFLTVISITTTKDVNGIVKSRGKAAVFYGESRTTRLIFHEVAVRTALTPVGATLGMPLSTPTKNVIGHEGRIRRDNK